MTNEDALTAAKDELRTAAKKDTMNEALQQQPRLPGWGEDITDPEVMAQARRSLTRKQN